MDAGTIAVIIIRMVVPLSILRWPLAGFALAWLLDVFDGPMAAAISPDNMPFGYGIVTADEALTYNLLDKWLDTYFLFFAFVVASRWRDVLARRTAVILFVLRFAGVVLFTATGDRYLLFFFPNILELFFPYYLITKRWFPRFSPDTVKKLVIVLAVLTILKLLNEYFVHVMEFQLIDTINFFTPFEIEADSVTDWVKGWF